MQGSFLILITVIGLVSAVLTSAGLLRLSRWVQERAARSAGARTEALAQIPAVQLWAGYGAIGLVLASFLAFQWAPAEGGSEIRTLAVATGVTALSYLVWFSIRWRRLR